MTDWLTTGICLCVSACLPISPLIFHTEKPIIQLLAALFHEQIFIWLHHKAPGIMFCHHKHNIPPWDQILNQSNSLLPYSTLCYTIYSQLPKWLYFFELLQFVCKLDCKFKVCHREVFNTYMNI